MIKRILKYKLVKQYITLTPLITLSVFLVFAFLNVFSTGDSLQVVAPLCFIEAIGYSISEWSIQGLNAARKFIFISENDYAIWYSLVADLVAISWLPTIYHTAYTYALCSYTKFALHGVAYFLTLNLIASIFNALGDPIESSIVVYLTDFGIGGILFLVALIKLIQSTRNER